MGTRRSSNPQAQVLRPGPVRCQPPGGALSKRGAAWRRSPGVRRTRRYSSRAHYTRASCARQRGHGEPGAPNFVTRNPTEGEGARGRGARTGDRQTADTSRAPRRDALLGAWSDRSSPSTTFSPRPVSFTDSAARADDARACSCILFPLGILHSASSIKQISESGLHWPQTRQLAEIQINSELGSGKGRRLQQVATCTALSSLQPTSLRYGRRAEGLDIHRGTKCSFVGSRAVSVRAPLVYLYIDQSPV